MKIEIESSDSYYSLKINGHHFCSASDECDSPEDMILGRDLAFMTEIPDLLKKAYEAGKNGEKFIIKEDI